LPKVVVQPWDPNIISSLLRFHNLGFTGRTYNASSDQAFFTCAA
jgi:hypothetical protein